MTEFQNNSLQQSDNLSGMFNNLSLNRKCIELDNGVESITDIMKHMNLIDEEEKQNESYYKEFKIEKFIPLEVRNLFCNKYFDDEDFVYMKLQLPQQILEYIAHQGNGDILDYFSSQLSTEIQQKFDNFEVYYNIISVYQYVINYYQNEQVPAIDRIKVFPLGYFKWLSHIIYTLKMNICFTPDTLNTFYEMSKIDQELSYGLNIIISQIKIIINYYTRSGMNIYQLTEQHIQRFIRLVNNLSVIMIYLKFCATEFKDHKELMENPKFVL